MANCNCIGTTKKRFQTRRQLLDAIVYYVDKDSSFFGSQGYLNFNIPAMDFTATMINAIYWSGSTISPIGDTTSTRDLIGNSTYIGVSGKDIYLYYNTIRRIQVTGSAGSSNKIGGEYLYIVITTDDVWLVGLNTVQLPLTSPSDGWAYTVPTSSAYGYFTNPSFAGGSVTPGAGVTASVYYNQNYVAISNDLKNAEIEIDYDPYANGGETDEGGGSGNFDYTGDTITEPSLPTVGAAATGFISLFNPSAAQLQSLMDYLWSPLFDLDTIKRLYADPMQQFVGLSLVPVPVPSAGGKTIQVGGISTGVTLTAAGAQFVRVDCGSISFSSSSLTASYLDFMPYTKTQLYLPYIGIVDISTDDIMDKTMSIAYHVDILTGGCIAYIMVGGSVMYQYSGQCAINVPLTSVDWSNTISSALSLVSSAMHGIVSGASVPLTGGLGVATGIGAVANMGATAVNAATNMKPSISKSGAIGGSSGIMAVQKPFLIVTCPNLARAKKQSYFTGYPSFITKYVSECSGFCSFEEIYLSGIGLTDSEMDELNAIMKEGVYL